MGMSNWPIDLSDVLSMIGICMVWYGISGYNTYLAWLISGIIILSLGIRGAMR